MLQVVKVGGAALMDTSWLGRFADAVQAGSSVPRVIVHGGGPEITQLSARLGLEAEFHLGRRITSEAALDLTSMVLTGRINKRIVRALLARDIDAFGLSGEDAATITGSLVDNGALGRVGQVSEVRTSVFEMLLAHGYVPVLSPVSIGTDGGALNINADEVASAVARQLDADELLFLTDVEGVRDGDQYLSAINAAEAQQLIERDVATGGMALKLRAAIAALKAGVTKVRVGSVQMLREAGAGTTLHAEENACR